MKTHHLIALFILFSFFTTAHAGGGITHMFLAEESIQLLPDAKLRQLLLNNLDAYRVGAYYPDSGYVKGNTYGEDSHWDPFIFTFADYVKETYPNFMTKYMQTRFSYPTFRGGAVDMRP